MSGDDPKSRSNHVTIQTQPPTVYTVHPARAQALTQLEASRHRQNMKSSSQTLTVSFVTTFFTQASLFSMVSCGYPPDDRDPFHLLTLATCTFHPDATRSVCRFHNSVASTKRHLHVSNATPLEKATLHKSTSRRQRWSHGLHS